MRGGTRSPTVIPRWPSSITTPTSRQVTRGSGFSITRPRPASVGSAGLPPQARLKACWSAATARTWRSCSTCRRTAATTRQAHRPSGDLPRGRETRTTVASERAAEASMHPGSRAASESDPAWPVDALLAPATASIWRENARLRAREAEYQRQVLQERQRADDLINVVIPVAIQLSVEQDFHRLLERILLGAKALCNADGGTLYLRTADRLQFMLMHTTSLNLALGGTAGAAIPHAPLRLYDQATRQPNEPPTAPSARLHGSPITTPDAYQAEGFDFPGTRAFDGRTGYRSTSFLTVPLKRGPERVIGVIQLLNALDRATGQVIPFDPALHP